MRSKVPLADAVALCSWLPLRNEKSSKLGLIARSIPIPVFMGHGDSDEVILQASFGYLSDKLLWAHDVDVNCKTYHVSDRWASEEELNDTKSLCSVLCYHE